MTNARAMALTELQWLIADTTIEMARRRPATECHRTQQHDDISAARESRRRHLPARTRTLVDSLPVALCRHRRQMRLQQRLDVGRWSRQRIHPGAGRFSLSSSRIAPFKTSSTSRNRRAT